MAILCSYGEVPVFTYSIVKGQETILKSFLLLKQHSLHRYGKVFIYDVFSDLGLCSSSGVTLLMLLKASSMQHGLLDGSLNCPLRDLDFALDSTANLLCHLQLFHDAFCRHVLDLVLGHVEF